MAKFKLGKTGLDKIQLIKLVKTYSELGLKESKDIVDNVPSFFYIDTENLDINLIIKEFEKSGAQLELVGSDMGEIKSEINQKSTYELKLLNSGANKLEVIKIIRKYSQYSLKESKDLIDDCPSIVRVELESSDINLILSELQNAGASVELPAKNEISIKKAEEIQKPFHLKLRILRPGLHTGEVVKLIKMFSGLSHDEAEQLIRELPAVLSIEDKSFEFSQIKKNFEAIGATVEQITEDHIEQMIEPGKPILQKPGAAGEINTNEPYTGIVTDKAKRASTSIEGLLRQSNPKQKNLDLRNALIFTNVAAIGFSYLSMVYGLYHFLMIFLVAFLIAYLLRQKNEANQKTGVFAFAFVIDYFILKLICTLFVWPIVLDYGYGADIQVFVMMLFHPANLIVLVAAALAYVLASSRNILKNLKNQEVSDNISGDDFPNEKKEISSQKKKLKF